MVIIPFDVRFLELVLFGWGVYLLLRSPSHLFMPVDRFKTLVFGIDQNMSHTLTSSSIDLVFI